MERLTDPDFAFFLNSSAPVRATAKLFFPKTSVYDRTVQWRDQISQRLERKQLHANLAEIRSCSFSPIISRRSRSISSSFASRLQLDQRLRNEKKVIAEFLKRQTEQETENHPFRPDLSMTSKFKLSKYLTRPIKIPHVL